VKYTITFYLLSSDVGFAGLILIDASNGDKRKIGGSIFGEYGVGSKIIIWCCVIICKYRLGEVLIYQMLYNSMLKLRWYMMP